MAGPFGARQAGVASLAAAVLILLSPRRRSILLTAAGLVGFLALISPFQIPLALGVGWAGAWLVRSDSRTARADSVAVPAPA